MVIIVRLQNKLNNEYHYKITPKNNLNVWVTGSNSQPTYSVVEDFQIREKNCSLFFIPSGEILVYLQYLVFHD
jgi:hypothetical protein